MAAGHSAALMAGDALATAQDLDGLAANPRLDLATDEVEWYRIPMLVEQDMVVGRDGLSRSPTADLEAFRR